MHAVQHVLLTLVAPPLLIAGLPAGMIRPAAPGARPSQPAPRAFGLHVLLAVTHLPPIFAAAMGRPPALGTLCRHDRRAPCCVVAPPDPIAELPRLSYPLQMLYCFALTSPVDRPCSSSLRPADVSYGDCPSRWESTPSATSAPGADHVDPSAIFFYVYYRSSSGSGSCTAARMTRPLRRRPRPVPILRPHSPVMTAPATAPP